MILSSDEERRALEWWEALEDWEQAEKIEAAREYMFAWGVDMPTDEQGWIFAAYEKEYA